MWVGLRGVAVVVVIGAFLGVVRFDFWKQGKV